MSFTPICKERKSITYRNEWTPQVNGILNITLKVDKFADKMIRDGNRARTRALFTMAAAGRNELRNVVRKRKKTSKPGAPPSDHGRYRKSALFAVDIIAGEISIGFSGIKPKTISFKGQVKKPLGSGLAQDKLEFGGRLKYRLISRDSSKDSVTRTIIIKPRPHVSVAENNLFTKNTRNAKRFIKAQQDLIDKGYLK